MVRSWQPRAGERRPTDVEVDRAVRFERGERGAFDELPAVPHPFLAHLDEQAAALDALVAGRA